MTDTVDALARAVLDSQSEAVVRALPSGYRWADDLAASLAAEGLSLVKTADWDRAQRVEAAVRELDKVATWSALGRPETAALREALEPTPEWDPRQPGRYW